MRNREGGGVDQAESAEERAELGVILGYELLLPPERLSDAEIDAQTLADIGVVRRCIAGRPDSVTVRLGLCAATCGWKVPVTEHEFYDALDSRNPTPRQKSILNAWATETRPEDLFRAWAEGAYTPRRLSAALHRSGHARTKAARFLNNFESAFRREIENLGGEVTPKARGKLVTAGWPGRKVDIWATTPIPRSGATNVVIDDSAETVLSTTQILRGKLERGEDCLSRDVYDLLQSAEFDRASLVAAANAAGRSWTMRRAVPMTC